MIVYSTGHRLSVTRRIESAITVVIQLQVGHYILRYFREKGQYNVIFILGMGFGQALGPVDGEQKRDLSNRRAALDIHIQRA